MNAEEANKRIAQLEEALMLMVYQYCVTDNRLDHRYLCAGEHAFAALGLQNGDSVEKLEEMETVLDLYDRVVHKDLLIRRVNIAACNLISEDDIPEDKPLQLDMFTDYEAVDREKKAQQAAEEKERKLQRVTLAIQDRFGKNAMLKGMNLMEGGTTIDRNGQIGGHKAGDE